MSFAATVAVGRSMSLAGWRGSVVLLRELLRLDPDQAAPLISEISAGEGNDASTVVLINGNETGDWPRREAVVAYLGRLRVLVVDPRAPGGSGSSSASPAAATPIR